MIATPPAERSRELSGRLAALEAPGINTLYGGEPNVLWAEAKGANVLDADGNRYVDLTSGFGVAAIGHRHPKVVDAVRRQAGRLLHGLGDAAAHPGRVALAERLSPLLPVDDPQVYFAVSGADAVEIVVKTAVLASGRRGLLCFEPAYHGLTLGALAASSRGHFRTPFEGHLQPFVHRLPFACPAEEIADLLDREEDIGCLLLEPIVGREGVYVPPVGWLSRLAEICRRRGVLLAADEIFTGFYRTGLRFAVDAEGVRPDLLACGKALAGGLPIGAAIGRRELMAAWKHSGEARHTGTFVAHPLACAAALAALDVFESPSFESAMRRVFHQLATRLGTWAERFEVLSEVRGRGALWGLEFASAEVAAELSERARQGGYLLLAGGAEGRVAQIAPPLAISEGQLTAALDFLEEILTGLGRHGER